jgi:hypothetical protein
MTLAGQVTRVEPFIYNPDYGSREPINYALGIRFFNLNESQQQVIEAYTQRVLNNMKQD